MEHMNLIAEYCTVFAVKVDRAIWYEDGGFKYADDLIPDEGWVSFSCNTQEEWERLRKVGLKDSESNPNTLLFSPSLKSNFNSKSSQERWDSFLEADHHFD